MYERCESYGRPRCEGHISFNLVGKTITREQLEVFEKFKADYGLEIKRIVRKYGIDKFKIVVTYKTPEGQLESLTTDNLEDVYNMLVSYVSEEKDANIDNEHIIGKSLSSQTLSKRLS